MMISPVIADFRFLIADCRLITTNHSLLVTIFMAAWLFPPWNDYFCGGSTIFYVGTAIFSVDMSIFAVERLFLRWHDYF